MQHIGQRTHPKAMVAQCLQRPASVLPLWPQGTFHDVWGGKHSIQGLVWVQQSNQTYHIIDHFMRLLDGHSVLRLIARNGQNNHFNGGLWSAFDIHQDNTGKLWYCQIGFKEPTIEAARRIKSADPRGVGSRGCGPFAWSELKKKMI